MNFFARPFRKILSLPSVRYSQLFPLFHYSPREYILKTAMEFVAASHTTGDYLEFGVYRGSTFVAAFHFAQMNRLFSMKFFAFDSFEGLPKVTGIDAEGFTPFQEGQYRYSIEQFTRTIQKQKVYLQKVKIIPGWYHQVLNEITKKQLSIQSAAVIYVDCDLYESTMPVLNFITDYIQQGTLLIFDDWFCFRGDSERGEQRAFREWLQKHPSIHAEEFHKFGWHGNSFILQT